MRATLEILDGPHYQRDDGGWENRAYTVRLTYDGRTMDTEWHQGLGITEDPDAESVLENLLSSAMGVEYDSFEEWAEDYGYDTDSRKAERTYHAVCAEAEQLRALLGDAFYTYERLGDPEQAARELTR